MVEVRLNVRVEAPVRLFAQVASNEMLGVGSFEEANQPIAKAVEERSHHYQRYLIEFE